MNLCFNLLSEILFVQALVRASERAFDVGFNLLSEILFVQALLGESVIGQIIMFQSLERDSVCSSLG